MKTKKSYNNIYLFLILGCVFISLIDSFYVSTSAARFISIGLALICIVTFIFRSSEFYLDKLLVITFIWILYNLIWLLFSYNSYYLTVIFQQAILLLFIWSASRGDSPLGNIKKLNFIIISYQIFALFFVVFTTRTGFVTPLFAFAFFVISMVSGTWKKVLICIFYMLIFWYSEERSRALALLLIVICIIVLPKLTKKLYKLTYWAVIAILTAIPNIYLWIYNNSGSGRWNEWIRDVSGKNLFSGRQHIWGYLEGVLSNNLLLGYGGKLVGGSLDVNLIYGVSSHNLFLFLRGQGGFILLLLFAFFLYYIWLSFYDYLSNPYVLVGAAYLVGLLVRASFDLVLMANNFVDSLFLWLPLVVAFSLTHSMRRNKTMNENNPEQLISVRSEIQH